MLNTIDSTFLLQMYVCILEEIKNPNLNVEYIRVHTLDEPDTITCSFYSSIESIDEEFERHDMIFSTKSFYYYILSFDKPVLITDFITLSDKVNKNTPNLDEEIGLILLYGAKEYPIDDTYAGILEDMEDYAIAKYSSLYRNILDIKPNEIKRIAEKENIQLDNLLNEVRSTTRTIILMRNKDNTISTSIINIHPSAGKPCDRLTPGLIHRYVMGYIRLKYFSYPIDESSFTCLYYKNRNTLGLENIKSIIW